jgi:hypothetical protein
VNGYVFLFKNVPIVKRLGEKTIIEKAYYFKVSKFVSAVDSWY